MDQPTIRDPAGGVNHSGIRDHNARLILSLIQRHEQLPSADIARRSGLSPQTVSVIIRSLEEDGLLLRGTPVRGKVGKPSIPMALDPAGALSLGLKIGRGSLDLVLLDLLGGLRRQISETHAYPTPRSVFEFLSRGMEDILKGLRVEEASRLTGIGVAVPYNIWEWLETIQAPPEEMEAWKTLDLAKEVAARTGLETYVANDATVACGAENVWGRGREFTDYAYFHVGTFVGGGVVLNSGVYGGRTGNAGAFGTLPIGDSRRADHQLIHHASLYLLERQLVERGLAPALLSQKNLAWTGFDDLLEAWIKQAGRALASCASKSSPRGRGRTSMRLASVIRSSRVRSSAAQMSVMRLSLQSRSAKMRLMVGSDKSNRLASIP